MDQTQPNNHTHTALIIIVFSIVGWLAATGYSKTQNVRILDIFLYGPYLIWIGLQEGPYEFSAAEKIFLLFMGATTITYNARNYLRLTA